MALGSDLPSASAVMVLYLVQEYSLSPSALNEYDIGENQYLMILLIRTVPEDTIDAGSV